MEVSQDETVTLKTKIQAEPRATIKWFRNNVQLVGSRRLHIDDDGGFYLLQIRNIVIQDAGKQLAYIPIHALIMTASLFQ